MKIIFTHYLRDYTPDWKITSRNYSADYYPLYLPLAELAKERGHELIPFWIDERIRELGREGMQQSLLATILREKPDLVLFYSGNEDDYLPILPELRRTSTAVTVFFGLDDSWHFDLGSRRVAPCVTWVATNFSGSVPRYRAIGCANVVTFRFGIDTQACRPLPMQKDIDVNFVGTWSKRRGEIVQALRDAGISVVVRGNGWPEGSVTQEEMSRIFSRSKMTLCLNPSAFTFGSKAIGRLFVRRAYLGEGGSPIKPDLENFFTNIRSWLDKRIPQIKVRYAAAYGSVELTQDADNFGDYFIPGKEVILYEDVEDLIGKIRHYLDHPAELEAISRASYGRIMQDFDTKKTLLDVFAAIGKPL